MLIPRQKSFFLFPYRMFTEAAQSEAHNEYVCFHGISKKYLHWRSSVVNFYSIGLYHNASSASIAVLTPFSLNPFLPLLFAVQSTSLFIEDEALIFPLPSNDWPVWVLWILPARIPWVSGVVAMEARVYLVTTLRPSCHRCNLCFMVDRTSPLRKQ